jgi:hypothetical protein
VAHVLLIGRSLAATAAAVVLAAGGMWAAPPARAAGDLQLSGDGIHFSSSFAGSIFPSDLRIVPGDTARGVFWVRNDSAQPAWLSIAMSGIDVVSADYSYALTLDLGVGGGRTRTQLLGDVSLCAPLAAPRIMEPGDSVRVDVGIGFDDVAGTAAQSSAAGLTFVAALSQAQPGASGAPALACGASPGAREGMPAPADGGEAPASDGSGVVHGEVRLIVSGPVPNTARLDEEYAILIPIAALAAGGLLALFASRAPRRHGEDPASHE